MVKATLEGQTIKWSLASVNITNRNFWFINIGESVLSKHHIVWLSESVLHMPIGH